MAGQPRTTPGARPASVRSPRRRAREFALQALYQWQLSGNDEAAIEAHLGDSEGFDKADREFFAGLLRGVLAQRQTLQEQLQAERGEDDWRHAPVEGCVLRDGALGLTKHPEAPHGVIINEPGDLGTGFGGTDGHKDVNGVRDKLAARLRPAEVEAKRAARNRAR